MVRKKVVAAVAAGVAMGVLAGAVKAKAKTSPPPPPPPPPGGGGPPPGGGGGPCPSTIQGWWSKDYNPNGRGPGIPTGTELYADLVDLQTAAQLIGVSNAVGAYAVYQIMGGYTVEEFVYPGFGGRAGNTWGLLQGYGYCFDGSCAASGSCPPR